MKLKPINLSFTQRLSAYTILLMIASTVFGGPLGLIVRGERHVLLLVLVLSTCYQVWSSKRDAPWTNRKYACLMAVPVLFFLINFFWIWPFGGQTPQQLKYGLLDAQSLILVPVSVFVLYAFLEYKFILRQLGRLAVSMCAVLAVIQVFLWVLLRSTDISQDVIYDLVDFYFGTRDSIAILKQPSNEGSYCRIVWISSYWLLFAVFISPLVFHCKIRLIILQAIFGLALIASYTRGIWLGLIFGVAGFTILVNAILLSRFSSEDHRKLRSKWNASLIGLFISLFLVLWLDWAQGTSGLMMSRLYLKSGNGMVEKRGIRDESAIERQVQTIKLLDMWKDRPMLGHGYGAYIKNHYSHEDRPFLYEMVPVALLMKLGILGFGIYLSFLAFISYRLLRLARRSADGVAIFSGLVGYLIQVHTNPVFFSFTGMFIFSIFIFLWLLLEYQVDVMNVDFNEK